MGRGRAKAKQQKVARELKYHTQQTDFTALQRELGHAGESGYDPAGYEAQDDFSDSADDDLSDDRWVSGNR
jgi:hypothetical protein